MKTKLIAACLIAASQAMTAQAALFKGLNLTTCSDGNEISDLREIRVWRGMQTKLGEIRNQDPVDQQIERMIEKVNAADSVIGKLLEKGVAAAKKKTIFINSYSWGGPVDETYYPVEDGCKSEPLASIVSPRLIEIRKNEFQSLPATDQAVAWVRLGLFEIQPEFADATLGSLPYRRLVAALLSDRVDASIIRGIIYKYVIPKNLKTEVLSNDWSEDLANISRLRIESYKPGFIMSTYPNHEYKVFYNEKQLPETDEAHGVKIKGYFIGKIEKPTTLRVRIDNPNGEHDFQFYYKIRTSKRNFSTHFGNITTLLPVGQNLSTHWFVFIPKQSRDKIEQFIKGIF